MSDQRMLFTIGLMLPISACLLIFGFLFSFVSMLSYLIEFVFLIGYSVIRVDLSLLDYSTKQDRVYQNISFCGRDHLVTRFQSQLKSSMLLAFTGNATMIKWTNVGRNVFIKCIYPNPFLYQKLFPSILFLQHFLYLDHGGALISTHTHSEHGQELTS